MTRCSRRRVLGGAAAFATLAVPSLVRAQRDVPRELTRLVAANRILAHEGVVDAFGHVSVRDPRKSRSTARLSTRAAALRTASA
jgi:hypothetical protein